MASSHERSDDTHLLLACDRVRFGKLMPLDVQSRAVAPLDLLARPLERDNGIMRAVRDEEALLFGDG